MNTGQEDGGGSGDVGGGGEGGIRVKNALSAVHFLTTIAHLPGRGWLSSNTNRFLTNLGGMATLEGFETSKQQAKKKAQCSHMTYPPPSHTPPAPCSPPPTFHFAIYPIFNLAKGNKKYL